MRQIGPVFLRLAQSQCQVDIYAGDLSGSDLARMREVANDRFHTSSHENGMENP